MTDNAGAPGAQGGDAAAAQAAADAAAAANGQSAADDAAAQQQAAADAAAQQQSNDPWADPEKAKAEIEKLRGENAKARVAAKAAAAAEAKQELLATLTAALDPEAGKQGQTLTLEQATEKLTDASTKLSDAQRELAITQQAWQLGVDPAKLPYLQFTLARNADVAELDASEADYSAKLGAAISAEIAKDSTLKLSGAAAASGVDQHGGAGASATITKAEWDGMSYAQRLDLYNTNKAEYDRLAGS